MQKDIQRRAEDEAGQQRDDVKPPLFAYQSQTGKQIEVSIDQDHVRRNEGEQLPVKTQIMDLMDAEGDQRGKNIIGYPEQRMIDPGLRQQCMSV